MKIRTGFVSNSSSSSFLVVFPKRPESKEEVLDILFDGYAEGRVKPYDDYLTNEQVADRVYYDITGVESKQIKTKKDLVKFLRESDSRYWYGSDIRYDECLYYMTNKKLAEQLRDTVAKEKQMDEEQSKYRGLCWDKYCAKNNVPKKWNDERDKHLSIFDKRFRKQKKYKEMLREENKLRKEKEVIIEKLNISDANAIWKDHKDAYIFSTRWSDNEGIEGAVLEHGDIYERVPHIRFSNH